MPLTHSDPHLRLEGLRDSFSGSHETVKYFTVAGYEMGIWKKRWGLLGAYTASCNVISMGSRANGNGGTSISCCCTLFDGHDLDESVGNGWNSDPLLVPFSYCNVTSVQEFLRK